MGNTVSDSKNRYIRAFDWKGNKKLKYANLRKITKAIWDEHSYRKTAKVNEGDGSATKNESARNFLRREIYALGSSLLSSSSGSQLAARLVSEIRAGSITHPEALSSAFHALLMCVYEDDEDISRQERSLMAMELEYAHRHMIPPELLCGFLYQSTDRKKLGAKLRDGFVEPAFQLILNPIEP